MLNHNFDIHLKHASKVVSTWPKWKQEALGGTATMNDKREIPRAKQPMTPEELTSAAYLVITEATLDDDDRAVMVKMFRAERLAIARQVQENCIKLACILCGVREAGPPSQDQYGRYYHELADGTKQACDANRIRHASIEDLMENHHDADLLL